MQQPVLAFWYEFASTYSFLAAERIDALAAQRNVAVQWKPFLLGPIFRNQGYTTSPFNLFPVKGQYMWRDMQRACDRMGLPLVKPDPFPQNSIAAARIAVALPDEARPAFSRAVFRMEFCEGRPITDEAALAAIVRETGDDLVTAVAASRTDVVKAELRRLTEEAEQLGLFGAPSFVTADGEIFWGNDRLEEALDWAVGQR
jgi:hypothetical protein